jgi:recombination protein RecA
MTIRARALSDTIAALKKGKSTANAFAPPEDLQGVSTGSLAVDIITGIGGFPRGRLSEVFGWEGSGKSTLCLQACAQAQRDGRFPVYLDAERGVDKTLAERIGFNMTDETVGLYLQPESFEQTMQIASDLAETGEAHLVVIDSIPAMVPETELDPKADIDKQQIGARARLLATTLPKITKTIAERGVTFVMVNQMRMKINTGAPIPSYMMTRENTEQSSGGAALKFYSSLRIDMSLAKKGEVAAEIDDIFTGRSIQQALANRHTAKIIKNKVGIPYRSASFLIRYEEERNLWGIDNLYTAMGLAVHYGLIIKKGSAYEYDGPAGNFKVGGVEALYDFLQQRPELGAGLIEQVLSVPAVSQILSRRA